MKNGLNACHLIGVIVTAINPTYKSVEVQHQLENSGAKAIILLDAAYRAAESGIKTSGVSIIIGTNIADLCGFSSSKLLFGRLLKKIPAGDLPSHRIKLTKLLDSDPDPPGISVDTENIAVLQYSGGTTGVLRS